MGKYQIAYPVHMLLLHLGCPLERRIGAGRMKKKDVSPVAGADIFLGGLTQVVEYISGDINPGEELDRGGDFPPPPGPGLPRTEVARQPGASPPAAHPSP